MDEGFKLKIPRCCFALQNRGFETHNLAKKKDLQTQVIFSWLGMRDSNPRMSAPKADALPLGESPVWIARKELNYFTIFGTKC